MSSNASGHLTETSCGGGACSLAGRASEKFPVIVTSYEIIIADSKLLQRYQWTYIVVDEGHRLKNFNCKLLRELRQIPVNNKLLLSGELAHHSSAFTAIGKQSAFGHCCTSLPAIQRDSSVHLTVMLSCVVKHGIGRPTVGLLFCCLGGYARHRSPHCLHARRYSSH